MERNLENILPILGVEQDCILSKQGDVTIAFKAELPEIFTLCNADYEAFHQTWIKAIKILPRHSVFHKQDWYIETKYKLNFKEDNQFLSRSSERFFNERPYLDHTCYIFITKKPGNRKSATSMMSGLLRKSIVPEQSMNKQLLQEFYESCGQFERILKDSGFVQLNRLKENALMSTEDSAGVIEKYCFLLENENTSTIKDIQFKDAFKIGDEHCQLYTLADINDLPALCGSRINYDKYSTDKTKFSVAFTSALGQLLPCSHIYNQFLFVDDVQKTGPV